ncbi:hypothetical protein ACFE04_028625 [Oxalis oulophora]
MGLIDKRICAQAPVEGDSSSHLAPTTRPSYPGSYAFIPSWGICKLNSVIKFSVTVVDYVRNVSMAYYYHVVRRPCDMEQEAESLKIQLTDANDNLAKCNVAYSYNLAHTLNVERLETSLHKELALVQAEDVNQSKKPLGTRIGKSIGI